MSKLFYTPIERQRIRWDMEKALMLAEIMDIQADGEEAGYIFDCLQRVRKMDKPCNLGSKVDKWFREYIYTRSPNNEHTHSRGIPATS